MAQLGVDFRVSFYISFNRECHRSTHMLDHFISPKNILRLAHNTPDHIQILLTLNRVRLSHRFGVAQSRCTPIARAHRNRSQPRTPQLPWNCRLTPHGQHNGRTRAAAANTHTPSISRDNPHTHSRAGHSGQQGVASCLRHDREGDPIRRVCAATTATTRMLLASCKHEPKQKSDRSHSDRAQCVSVSRR